MTKYVDQSNKRFLPTLPRFEPIVQDHTAMSTLDECDRKYFYRIVLGRSPQKSNTQVCLDAGTIYHKFREVLELTWKESKSFDKAFGEAIKSALNLQLDIPPAGSKYEYINREFIIKCFGLAFERFKNEKANGKIEVIATEQPFNIRMPDGLFIGGRADEIIKWGGSIWGRDFKFSSKNEEMWKRLVNPNEQATRYIVGETGITGQRVEGIIFEVLHHEKGIKKENNVPRIRIESHLATRTDYELKEWELERSHINKQLELNREFDIWPKRDFKNNCAWCDYALVCRQPSQELMTAKLLENYRLTPWDFEHIEQEEI